MQPISEKVYGYDDVIKCGRMKTKTVGEILKTNRSKIFELVKKGYLFDDNVLKDAHITKSVRDYKVDLQLVEHAPADKKTYAKDTASLKSILKSLNMDIDDIYIPNEVEFLDDKTPCEE